MVRAARVDVARRRHARRRRKGMGLDDHEQTARCGSSREEQMFQEFKSLTPGLSAVPTGLRPMPMATAGGRR